MYQEEDYYSPHGSDSLKTTEEKAKQFTQKVASPLFEWLGIRASTRIPAVEEVISMQIEESGTEVSINNERIDAGWTYFGQFVSHDVTSRRELGDSQPRLNLESLYGFGPKVSGYLYEVERDPRYKYDFRAVRFVFDAYRSIDGYDVDDVFRIGERTPVMADVRNDDNFLVSQLHCTFMQFHNRMAEFFHRKYGKKQGELFDCTRQFVIWTYQWLIVNKYLQLLTDKVADELIQGKPYKILSKLNIPGQPLAKPILMPEFAIAAMRMGHSQVRTSYQLNAQGGFLPLYAERMPDLRGFVRDRRRGPIDWHFFFDFNGQKEIQKSRPLDSFITPPLGRLPFLPKCHRNLASINIDRSANAKLVIEEKDLGKLNEIGITTFKSFAEALDSLKETYGPWWHIYDQALMSLPGWPLWIFILLEARAKGVKEKHNAHVCQHLGPLGAQIIAEQLVWILQEDSNSYLQQPNSWQPMDELYEHYTPVNSASFSS